MSKLSQLKAKPKEFTIGGEVFNIKPLTAKNLDTFVRLSSTDLKIRSVAMADVLKETLKASEEGCTDEEIDNLPVDIVSEFLDAILEVNGQNVKSENQEALEKLKSNAKSAE